MSEPGFDKQIIAPCGMNCGICRAHLRKNNSCPGCRHIGPDHPKTRVFCHLRLCDRRKGAFCSGCDEFPCDRLKRLDSRYRDRYGMSEIQNLECIRDTGLMKFIAEEEARWTSSEGILCVHDRKYYQI